MLCYGKGVQKKGSYDMKKKILSAVAAIAVFMSTAAFAATPKVVLDNRTIDFEDQEPVILENEGRTLVPLRSVFEHMGAKVEWYEKDRSIAVYSADGFTKIILQIDNNDMIIRTFTSLIAYNDETIKLDAPPRIMNDRTMVPLRVISEALDCDVSWDEASYTIAISTKKDDPSTGEAPAVEDNRVKMSISADKTDVNAGDEVKVFVNASNVENKQMAVTAVSARVMYDKTKFEYVGFSPVIEGAEKDALNAVNPEYNNDSVKGVYITIDSKEHMKDGAVMVFTFKALTDEGGEFALSNAVSSTRGNDTSVAGQNDKEEDLSFENDDELIIDTAPIKVN